MSYEGDGDSRRRRRGGAPAMIYTVPVPLEVFKFSPSLQATKLGSFKVGVASIEGSSAIYIPDVLEEIISSRFSWTIQEKNGILYGSFPDSSKHTWSIKFDSRETSESFTIHVAIAVGQYMRELHTHDLNEGKGEAVQEGDACGVKWIGFSVAGGTIDEQFSVRSKIERVVLGDGGYLKGLEEGIVGMKSGGKRIIVIPPGQLASTRGGVQPQETPAKSTIVFLLELEKIKFGNRSGGGNAKSGSRSNNRESGREGGRRRQRDTEESEEEDYEPRERGGRKKIIDELKTMTSEKGRSRDQRDDDYEYNQPKQYNNNNHNQQQQQQQQGGGYNNMNQGFPGNHGFPGNQGFPGSQFPGGINPLNPYGQPAINPLNPFAPANPGALALVSVNPYTGQPMVPPPSPYAHPYAQPPPPAPAPAPAPAPPPPVSNALATTGDTIQLLVEERQFKGQIDSKLEIVIAKVDQLNDRVNIMFGKETQDLQVSSGISAQALLHTITRIVEDNERLEKEVEEQSASLSKTTQQYNSLLEENQKSQEVTSKYDEERNVIFTQLQQQQKKKIDQLIDERENLQIEMGTITTDMGRIEQENNKLRKKYQSIAEELQNVREEADRERKLKEAGADDVEAAKQELSNFKNRYREENRRMNEAVQEKQHLLQELSVIRERAERLQAQLDERLRSVETSKMTEQNEWLAERNTLQEEIQKLKTVLQTRTKEARDRIEEMKNELLQQQEDDRAAFRQKAREELDRRVNIAVQQALDNAAVQAGTDTQKAVTEARFQYQKEKENALQLQQEDFQVRLTQEVKDAFERGRRQGITEGLGAKADGNKPAEILSALDGSSEKVAALEHTISELESQLESVKGSVSAAVKKTRIQGLLFLHETSKALMNDTFKNLRAGLDTQASYQASQILSLVRDTLVNSTMTVLPPLPDDDDEEEANGEENGNSFAVLQQKQEIARQQQHLQHQASAIQHQAHELEERERKLEKRERELAHQHERFEQLQREHQNNNNHHHHQQPEHHQPPQQHRHHVVEDAAPVREERPEITLAADPPSSSSTSSFEEALPEPVVSKPAPVEAIKPAPVVEEPKVSLLPSVAPAEVVEVAAAKDDLWGSSDSEEFIGVGNSSAKTKGASQKSVWGDESDSGESSFTAKTTKQSAATPAIKDTTPKKEETKPQAGLVDGFFEPKKGASIWGDEESEGDLWS